jgi:N-acetylmuramoyl-L-alanine amidase
VRRRPFAIALVVSAVVGAGIVAAVALGDGGSSVKSDYAVATSGLERLEPADTAEAPAVSQPTETQAAPAPAPSLAGKTVTIDPGHNGGNASHPSEINRMVDIGTGKKECDTAGAETASGYTEAAYNFDVAQRLRRILGRLGARVVVTRKNNTGVGPCIDERARIGNRAHADAAISIHADGGPSSGRGFHVIYPESIPGLTDGIVAASKRLALDLRAAYQQGTGMPRANYIGSDGLDQRGDLGGLNLSDVPKVFIETGNMNNPTDAAKLEAPGFRQRVAAALAVGIERFVQG